MSTDLKVYKEISCLIKYLTAILLSLSIFSGCYSLSTFQSPVVLEKGEISGGFGFTGYIDQEEGQLQFYEFDTFLRGGLLEDFEGGLKLYGFPALGGGLQGDFKYQVIEDPVFIAVDMAVFYALGPKIASEDYSHTYGYTPMILVGNKTFYCGYKYIIGFVDAGLSLGSSSRSLEAKAPALIFGLTIGESFQIMPEINYYFGPDENLVMLGLGFQLK